MAFFYLSNEAVDTLTRNQIYLDTSSTVQYNYALGVAPITPTLFDTYATYNANVFPALYGYADIPALQGNWSGSTTGGIANYVNVALTWTFSANPGSYSIYYVFAYAFETVAAVNRTIGIYVLPTTIPGCCRWRQFVSSTPTWQESIC